MKKIVLFKLLLIMLFSCSKADKFAVILWDLENEDNNGKLSTVAGVSYLDSTVSVITDEERTEIPLSLVEFFKSKKNAKEFKKNYYPIKDMYATTTRANHAIRALPDASSERLGSILRNEIAKVIWVSPEKEIISNYEEYWYKIVLSDGRKGYTYGSFIDILEASTIKEEIKSLDYLGHIFNSIQGRMYPEEFVLMIEQDVFEVNEKYSTNYLELDTEKSRLIIRSDVFNGEIDLEEITETSNSEVFRYNNNTSTLTISQNKVTLSFLHDNEAINLSYINIGNIKEKINAEFDKLEEIFQKVLNEQKKRESSVYGSLTFYENKTFKWENNHRLVPQIISRQSETGKVMFEKTISKKLREKYDAVLTLQFDSNEKVHFLIKVENDATLRLENTNIRDFNKNVLVRLNSKPINIVMRSN